MIKEALQWLKDNFVEPKTIEIGGFTYVKQDGYQRLENAQEDIWSRASNGEPLELGTVGSLCELIQWYRGEKDEAPIRVVVGSESISAVFDLDGVASTETWDAAVNRCLVQFKPPWKMDTPFDFEKFMTFLDDHSGSIDGEEELRRSLAKIKISSSDEITVQDMGAFTTFTAKVGRDVKDAEFRIPKEICIKMETGTREFLLPNRFLLRIDLKGPSFRLIRSSTDNLAGRLVEAAIGKLKVDLAETANVLILEG